MTKQASDSGIPFGVHSEVGKLRKVMVCSPGRAHQRLTPSNCDTLLFDDVLWVENAKRDHFDFMQKMRDRGVEVVEMHNLLAETVAIPVTRSERGAPEARNQLMTLQSELWSLIRKEAIDAEREVQHA